MTENESSSTSSLVEQLSLLTLEVENLRAEVRELRERVETEPRSEPSVSAVEASIVQAEELPTTHILIGDRVVLRNPGRSRVNTGIVKSITVGGFLRIELDNGQKVRRLPRNVSKQEQ